MRDITPPQRPIMPVRRSIDGIIPRESRAVTGRQATPPVQLSRRTGTPQRSGLSGYHPDTSRFIDNVIIDKRPLGQQTNPGSAQAKNVAMPVSAATRHTTSHAQATEQLERVVIPPVIPADYTEPEQPTLARQINSKKSSGKSGLVRDMVSNLGVVLLAAIIGISFFDQTVGMWVISVASLVGLVIKLDSRYYFGAAVFALVMIPILSIMQRTDMSNNYAVYAFVLMVFGTLASVIELMRQSWRQKKISKSSSVLSSGETN